MKMYKGFHEDMTCKSFQYEEGKTYEEDYAKLCEKGFHACEDPLDCFSYYAPGSSVFHEVELEATNEISPKTTKRCGKKITIGKRLSPAEIFEAHRNYAISLCISTNGKLPVHERKGIMKNDDCVVAGDFGTATACNKGTAAAGRIGGASAGYEGVASAGYKGIAVVSQFGVAAVGDRGISSAGKRGIASAGNRSQAIAGDLGCAATGCEGTSIAGNCGTAAAGYGGTASAGERGCTVAGEKGSAAVGNNGMACCRGGKVKGGIGAVLSLSEVDDEGRNLSCACAIVDGEKIKADTWYKCVNGELVEA